MTTQPAATNLTWQVLVLCLIFAIGIGIYLGAMVRQYVQIRADKERRHEVVQAFRKMLVAFAWWMFPVSFFVRTGLVVLGVASSVAGEITFFSLLMTNAVVMIYAVVSLWYD